MVTMLKEVLLFVTAVLASSLVLGQSLTPALDIVVITSEYIKPSKVCEESHSFSKGNTTEKLQKLREQMRFHNISGYVIFAHDEHQSEAVSDHDKRLKYISGFTGSNGIAVVTLKSAALWTDSRYFSQAEDQMDCNWVLMRMGVSGTPTIEEWLSSQLKKGEAVSSDPKICAYDKWISWNKNLEKSNLTMKLVKDNLIDKIWKESDGRPPKIDEPIFILDVNFAGVTWQEKLALIRDDMKKAEVDTFAVTALDEIAWTLNLRGSDIQYFPVFPSYLVIQAKKAFLYMSNKKVTPGIIKYLNANGTTSGDSVEIRSYEEIWNHFPELCKKSSKVGLPSKFSYFSGINYLLYASVPEDKITMMTSPILLRKDVKNPTEIAGMKASHIRDGVVVCQFLAMLEEEVTAGSTNWTELKAAQVINGLRRKQKYNVGLSFGTISAFGKNAANAHYQPSPQTDTVINRNHLFMLDSGGQYYDGTTDCTRTVHFGTPRDIEREVYTRLLIGCINVASVVFKAGYSMKQLEILIRAPLFEIGLDYGHGSTHGIGSFLAVHEAFNISYQEGFFGSQEPGYYEENAYGMRLENIVTVVKAPSVANNKSTYLTFEPVTLIPYERKLIKIEMLERKHIEWLNNYHQKVRELVGAEMLRQNLKKEYQWLLKKTEPISSSQ